MNVLPANVGVLKLIDAAPVESSRSPLRRRFRTEYSPQEPSLLYLNPKVRLSDNILDLRPKSINKNNHGYESQ
jgi:hypothetical protein